MRTYGTGLCGWCAAATADMQLHLNGPMMETLASHFASSTMDVAEAYGAAFSQFVSAAYSVALRVPSMFFNWAVLGFLHGFRLTSRIADQLRQRGDV